MMQPHLLCALLVSLSAGCLSLDGLQGGKHDASGGAAGALKDATVDRSRQEPPDAATDDEDVSEGPEPAETGEPDVVVEDDREDPNPDAYGPDATPEDQEGVPDACIDDARQEDGEPDAPPDHATEPLFGLDGPYSNINVDELAGQGIGVLLIQLHWALIATNETGYSDNELTNAASDIERYGRSGLKVVLDLGLSPAPGWVKTRASNSVLVNELGQRYAESNDLNLVWSASVREIAARYIAHVFERLGSLRDWLYAVRIGGGRGGTLTYPWKSPQLYNFWAFDPAANQAKSELIKSWVPGNPSPNGEAAAFLEFYLNGLVNFELWQLQTIRQAGYQGMVAVAMGGEGESLSPAELTTDDLSTAAGANLKGGVSAEKLAQIQLGLDYNRYVTALADAHATPVAIWCAAAERTVHLAWFAGLAAQHGLPLMGENRWQTEQHVLAGTVRAARDNGLSLFMWASAPGGSCQCVPATLADYVQLIASP